MSINPGVTPIQPQSFFRYNKPEARPYVTVALDPEHGDFGPFTPGTQTAGIQEAINFVSALGGGTVFVKRGRYVGPQYAYISVPSNVRVVGEGIDATILSMTVVLGSQTQQGPSAPLTTNAALEDLTLDGTGFGSNQNGISYRYVQDTYIRRVKVFNVPFWSIFGAFESGVPTSPSLFIEDCIFDRNRSYAGDMSAFNNNNYVLMRNTVWRNNTGGGSTCLFYSGQNIVELEAVTFENNSDTFRGLYVEQANIAKIRGVTSDGSSVDQISATSIMLEHYSAPPVGTIYIGSATYIQASEVTAGGINVFPVSGGVAVMSHINAGQLQFFPPNGGAATFVGQGINVTAALSPGGSGAQPGVLGVIGGSINSPTTARLLLTDVVCDGGLNLADFAPSTNLITYVGSITNLRIIGNNSGGGVGNGNITLGQILGSPTEPFTIEGGFVYNSIVYASPNQIVNHKIRGIEPYVEPNIPVNPPVSGTTYLNVNPFGIVLLIPVALTPTASAAASATIAVGSSPSTLSTVQTLTQAAGASPTGGVLQAAVPSGQYYQITLTNATAYQAIVLPE